MNNALDMATALGALYGALQGIAQVVMLFASKNTLAWKWAKYVVSGQSRDPSSST